MLALSLTPLALQPSWDRRALLRRAASASVGGGAALGGWASALRAIPPMPDEAAEAPQVLYTPPAIKGQSSKEALALAKHLQKVDAKMYGAYWCSHCFNQKMMFGAGATRQYVNYVECAPDGYKSERALCLVKDVKAYPSWEINGKFYAGEQSLADLADLSGMPPGPDRPKPIPVAEQKAPVPCD